MSTEWTQQAQASWPSSASSSTSSDPHLTHVLTPPLSNAQPASRSLSDSIPTFKDQCDFSPWDYRDSMRGATLNHHLRRVMLNHREDMVQSLWDELFLIALLSKTGRVDQCITSEKLDISALKVEGSRDWRESMVHRALMDFYGTSSSNAVTEATGSELSSRRRSSPSTTTRSSTLSSASGIRCPDQLLTAHTTIHAAQATISPLLPIEMIPGSSRSQGRRRERHQTFEFVLPSMVIEYKPLRWSLWHLLCQSLCYASQLFFFCRCNLAFMARHLSFARVIALAEDVMAVEVSSDDQQRIRESSADDMSMSNASGALLRILQEIDAPTRKIGSVKPLFTGRHSVILPNTIASLGNNIPEWNAVALSTFYTYMRLALQYLLRLRTDQPLRAFNPVSEADLKRILEGLQHCAGFDFAGQDNVEGVLATLRQGKQSVREGKRKAPKQDIGHGNGSSRNRTEGNENQRSTQATFGHAMDSLPSALRDEEVARYIDEEFCGTEELGPEDSASQADDNDNSYESAVSAFAAVFVTTSQMDKIVDNLLALQSPIGSGMYHKETVTGEMLQKVTLENQTIEQGVGGEEF